MWHKYIARQRNAKSPPTIGPNMRVHDPCPLDDELNCSSLSLLQLLTTITMQQPQHVRTQTNAYTLMYVCMYIYIYISCVDKYIL